MIGESGDAPMPVGVLGLMSSSSSLRSAEKT